MNADRNAPVPPINRAGLDSVLAYLPVFQRPGFKFGEWVYKQGELPHYQYSPEVDRFVSALYAANLVYPFDWGQFVERAQRYRDEPDLLASADLLTLRKLAHHPRATPTASTKVAWLPSWRAVTSTRSQSCWNSARSWIDDPRQPSRCAGHRAGARRTLRRASRGAPFAGKIRRDYGAASGGAPRTRLSRVIVWRPSTQMSSY